MRGLIRPGSVGCNASIVYNAAQLNTRTLLPRSTQRRILLKLASSASSRRLTRARSPPMATHIVQKRAQSGHSHGGHHHHHHHHHGDNAYLTSKNKNDPGVRITRIGLYVNLGMAIAKGAGGYVFNSKALTADAVHALTDLVSDIMTLATISWSIRPATSRFPMGYGKIESLGALAVSCILLGGGIGIGLQAVLALSQQFFPHIHEGLSHLDFLAHSHSHSHGHDHDHGHGHGHGHGATELGPNINAAWLAAGSIVLKEWLYHATMKVAKEKRSSVLSSNAYHHRIDSLTAFVALFTIVASHFLEGARWLDPVGGLVISGMIVQAGWGNTVSALYELADRGLDDEIREKAETTASATLKHFGVELRGLQGIKSGQNLMFEVEIAVPKDWTVARTDEVEQAVRGAIAQKVRGTKRVTIRFTIKDGTAFADEFVVRSDDPEHGAEDDHDHDHEHDHDHDHADGNTTGNSKSQKQK